MDVGEFSGPMVYTGLRLDYSFRLWAPTSVSRAIAAVADELLVTFLELINMHVMCMHVYNMTRILIESESCLSRRCNKSVVVLAGTAIDLIWRFGRYIFRVEDRL